jgi:hypothetical protein
MTADYNFSMCKGQVPLSPLPKEAMGGWHTDYNNVNQNQMVGMAQVGENSRMVFTATMTEGYDLTTSVATDAQNSGVPHLPGGDSDDLMLIVGDGNTSVALAYKDQADTTKTIHRGGWNGKHTLAGMAYYCINTYLLFYCDKPRQ